MQADPDIIQIVTEYVQASDHPDLVVYRRDLDGKLDVRWWVGEVRRRCALGGFYGRRLLEVGCGFGWDAVGISLAGGNEVVATDILPSMIEGVSQCLAAMAARGRVLPIVPVQGDICSLDLPDEGFDGIYSAEAVEHVRDLDAMFHRCFRMLKPGGRLLIVNDSNRLNSGFREATLEMWKERDESWEHARWLRDEVRPVEHRDAKPYAAMREAIIREAAPDLDAASAARLTVATAGMIRPGIVAATRTLIDEGTLPTRPDWSWCRNPETGEYAERLLDPFELAEMLRRQGFRNVRVRHGFNRFPVRLLNGVRFRPLNRLLFELRPLFYVVADRPPGRADGPESASPRPRRPEGAFEVFGSATVWEDVPNGGGHE